MRNYRSLWFLFLISYKAYSALDHFHQRPKTDVSFWKHHVFVVLEVFFFLAPSCVYIINFTSIHNKRKACMEFIFNTLVTDVRSISTEMLWRICVQYILQNFLKMFLRWSLFFAQLQVYTFDFAKTLSPMFFS